MKKTTTRQEEIYRLSLAAYFTAFALILAFAESFLPPLIPAVPFARLGLSNIAVMVAFVAVGFKCAFVVLIAKCIISSVFVGNLFGLVYSLPAGIISFLVFVFLFLVCRKFLNIAVVSVLSAFVHNIVQITVAGLFVKNFLIMSVLPLMAIISCIAGVVTAVCTKYILIKVFNKESKHALQ